LRKNELDSIPLTPPIAPCLLTGSVLTPSLGAHLLTQNFCYHSTFYREQWKLKAAHGIELEKHEERVLVIGYRTLSHSQCGKLRQHALLHRARLVLHVGLSPGTIPQVSGSA
jgi:hypothetical protein